MVIQPLTIFFTFVYNVFFNVNFFRRKSNLLFFYNLIQEPPAGPGRRRERRRHRARRARQLDLEQHQRVSREAAVG